MMLFSGISVNGTEIKAVILGKDEIETIKLETEPGLIFMTPKRLIIFSLEREEEVEIINIENSRSKKSLEEALKTLLFSRIREIKITNPETLKVFLEKASVYPITSWGIEVIPRSRLLFLAEKIIEKKDIPYRWLTKPRGPIFSLVKGRIDTIAKWRFDVFSPEDFFHHQRVIEADNYFSATEQLLEELLKINPFKKLDEEELKLYKEEFKVYFYPENIKFWDFVEGKFILDNWLQNSSA